MKLYWIFYLLVQSVNSNILDDSLYTIIAPASIKSYRNYSVAVTLNNVKDPCLIRLALQGPSLNLSQNVELKSDETKLIQFQLPKLFKDEYKLITEGVQGVSFKNETNFQVYSDDGPKVYIQTDKGYYDPMDIVKFRILILDEHTRPLNTQELISVNIRENYDYNLIKSFQNITLNNGVFEGQFQISQNPILRVWLFEVKIGGIYDFTYKNMIIVKKFILPKFKIHIEAPKHLKGRLGLNKLKAKVYGTYRFGSYVKGNGTAKVLDKTNDKQVDEKEFDLNQTAKVELSFYSRHNIDDIILEVSITDKYSGITETSEFPISIHLGSFNINVPEKEIEYRDNIPHRLKVYIRHWSGEVADDQVTPVKLKCGGDVDLAYLNDEGIATFDLDSYEEYYPGYVIEYKDSGYRFYLEPKRDYDQGYFKLKLLTERPHLGDPVEIKVISPDTMPYFVYIIISHSNIIHMEHIKIQIPQYSYIIRFNPSIEMIPQAYVFVYYMDNGNLRSSEMKIKFPHEFENKISIKAPELALPGQKISLEINAQPGSYVGILAVDKKLFPGQEGYDLRRDLIFHDLYVDGSYFGGDKELPPGIISGLKVLSNGHVTFLKDVEPEDPAYVSYGKPEHYPTYDKTWIFQSLIINSPNTQLTFDVPESSTNWRVTAFSINNITGFGMTDKPIFIDTIKPYRITFKLPYTIKLGEILVISVILHNDLKSFYDNKFTLYNDNNEFEIINTTKDVNDTKHAENNNGTKFIIKPLKIGEIKLHILATNGLYIDSKEQKLKVIHGGVKQKYNEAIFEKTLDNETFSGKFSIKIPENTINNTIQINLSASTDILMPTIENLEKLIFMPTAAGEPNMINFASGVLILQYLTSIGKHLQDKELVSKIKHQIEMGYQQQLAYRKSSGGFVPFGEQFKDEQSIWLTANVIRYYIKATKFNITIEPELINSGLEYLKQEQLSDGSYSHNGYLIMPAMESKYALTSFVLVTLLESRHYANQYRSVINKSVEYLETNLDNIQDIYDLALTATAFKCAGSNAYFHVTEKLLKLSKENDLGHKWWSANDGSKEKDIELTSYIQLALIGAPFNDTPVLKWLIAQRNELGGFISTQDTVMGILALIKLARFYQNTNDSKTTLLYTARDEDDQEIYKGSLDINTENFKHIQKQELPNTTRSIEYNIEGSGYTFAQLYYEYYIPTHSAQQYQHFKIELEVNNVDAFLTNLEICFEFNQNSSNSSNMIIMEINLPTGFQSDADYCMKAENYDSLKRIEAKNDDTLVIFYFSSLKALERNCINIDLERTSEIMELQPGSIKMYDYYNTSRTEMVFYDIKI